MDEHTCPWWLGYSFDNPLRKLIHNPTHILGDMVQEGQTVVDIGCGLGFFTLALSRMVGPHGKVLALDLQPQMLDRTQARARRHGLEGPVDFRLCGSEKLGLTEPVDFVLAFWMVHEVRNQREFLAEVRSALKPSGCFLIVEPIIHVPEPRFKKTVELARASGFAFSDGPQVRFSRSLACLPST
jgi:ubiquinone/menaquinone biosynthesis C-methylase UbiE